MIQRIQSVYLFLAAIAIVVMFFFPIANFYSDLYYFYLSLDGISDETFLKINTIPLITMVVILIVLILFSIFIYKNRLLQARIIRFAILIDISFIIVLYFGYIDNIIKSFKAEGTTLDVEYKAGIYFPLIVLILLVLAMRGVLNDEKKVKAADRLR
ncbi:MAG: DUF4293 domain-containing protein [Bacteroidales bacterium]|nr:DUF4293 domain-containing protein [Bacteroidales bacterium]